MKKLFLILALVLVCSSYSYAYITSATADATVTCTVAGVDLVWSIPATLSLGDTYVPGSDMDLTSGNTLLATLTGGKGWSVGITPTIATSDTKGFSIAGNMVITDNTGAAAPISLPLTGASIDKVLKNSDGTLTCLLTISHITIAPGAAVGGHSIALSIGAVYN